jgi:hypothetical protein
MQKKTFATRFGLIALMSVSLFASTAFAGNAPAASPVIVTNTPAQPVPMVGLIKDSDAPARKPFQTVPIYIPAQLPANFYDVVTVPVNQRLVIEHVSGTCANITGCPSLLTTRSRLGLASSSWRKTSTRGRALLVPHPFGCM